MLDDALVIVIDNDGPSEHPWGKVKDLVVDLSGQLYFRHADNYIVKILGPDNKRRFYRKESPLITKDFDNPGEYVLKSMCYLTEDGVYLSKTSPSVVILDGKPVRKAYVVQVDGVYYRSYDERITNCCCSKTPILKEGGVLLDPTIYGKDTYTKSKYVTVDREGRNLCTKDTTHLIYGLTGEPVPIYVNWIEKQATCSIAYDFQDKTNPQLDRVTKMYMLAIHKDMIEYVDFAVPAAEIPEGIPPEQRYQHMANPMAVHKSKVEYFKSQINDYIVPKHLEKLDGIRAAINKKYSDLDDTENTAKTFKVITEQIGGKINIFTSKRSKIPVESRSFIQTGGLKYSFGVELETSQGLLTIKDIDALMVSCVGDRSIGSGEYVTPPLEGNAGMLFVKNLCKALNQHTLVDDRCGVHVHVGGLDKHKSPSFTKRTLINAIHLACLIEEELFMTLPASRKPTLHHCHSVKRFGAITQNTYAKYMGAYIFGPEEWWLDPTVIGHKTLSPFFEFNDYKLGKGRTSATGVDQWCGGRYKWINLVHAFMKGDKKTYEFRIFPGTTNFEKVWAYIMFSLAFVHVIDNHPEIIKEGVTLKDIVNCAYSKSKVISETLNNFHEGRKALFKRQNIYPALGYENKPLTFLNK